MTAIITMTLINSSMTPPSVHTIAIIAVVSCDEDNPRN